MGRRAPYAPLVLESTVPLTPVMPVVRSVKVQCCGAQRRYAVHIIAVRVTPNPRNRWFLANFRDRRIFEDYQHLYQVVNIYRNVFKSELKSHRLLASTTRHNICSIKKDSETTQPLQGGCFTVATRSKRSGFALALLSHAIEHTLFQQIDVSPAKHLALEHF